MNTIKSRNQIQKENLLKMFQLMGHFAWISIYLIAISATPALLISLPGSNTFILMSWKLQITMLVMLPIAFLELLYCKPITVKFKFMYFKKFMYMIFASAMYLLWFYGLLEA